MGLIFLCALKVLQKKRKKVNSPSPFFSLKSVHEIFTCHSRVRKVKYQVTPVVSLVILVLPDFCFLPVIPLFKKIAKIPCLQIERATKVKIDLVIAVIRKDKGERLPHSVKKQFSIRFRHQIY
ncbi:hypothetical protein NPIL_488161 [Nephila pilipes]|uniref:Uncharacterized protein n=1 Tax=Nephila pilipes TaxID=299642 RepID=A0A8X6P3P8_NEPPI|nr:hypothetical protein NPIL_488161 [Nephila pilipes]